MATASRCAKHGRYTGPDGCDVCCELDHLTRLAQERHQRVLGLIGEVVGLKQERHVLQLRIMALHGELARHQRGFWAKLKAFAVGDE